MFDGVEEGRLIPKWFWCKMIGCVEAEAGLWVEGEGEGELSGILSQKSINLPVLESGATPRDAFTYWNLDGNWSKEHSIPTGEILLCR